MTALAPSIEVIRDHARCPVYCTVSGLFTLEDIDQLFSKFLETSQPFIEDRKGFRVLGDLRKFTVQTHEVGEMMRTSQETSAKVGVEKKAIVYSSVLMMQQFRRASKALASKALECEFFTRKADAIAWMCQD